MQSKSAIRTKHGARVVARAGDLARKSIKAQVEAMASASVADVARIMGALVASGDIAFEDDLPEEDAPESIDEAMEDAFRSEFDWSDEDGEIFEPETPLSRHVFVIRVCRDEAGAIRCLPPYSDWAGAEGKTAIGREYLKVHNHRLRTYRVLGEFLVREHAAALKKGPSALALGLEQKAFAQKWLASEGVEASQLSRFLEGCDLVWDADLPSGGESLPVRNLFRGQ